MGCGAVKDPSAINDLIGVLNDPSTSVRLTAVLALASISTAATTRVLVELLLNGSEDLRQAAAEVFATDPKEGYEILKEAAGVEDILTRRAVVAGLIQVKKPWAKEMLEKMAVEDSQWVVRNAAAQGLEVVQSTSPYLPTPLPVPWESAWLLEFASKQGEGVTPGVMPVDLLIKALNDEKPENIIQALQYLKFIDEEGIIANVYKLYFGDENYVREAAQRAIWHLACSGAALPSTMAYGYA
jgi:HEAT repeat protein